MDCQGIGKGRCSCDVELCLLVVFQLKVDRGLDSRRRGNDGMGCSIGWLASTGVVFQL